MKSILLTLTLLASTNLMALEQNEHFCGSFKINQEGDTITLDDLGFVGYQYDIQHADQGADGIAIIATQQWPGEGVVCAGSCPITEVYLKLNTATKTLSVMTKLDGFSETAGKRIVDLNFADYACQTKATFTL